MSPSSTSTRSSTRRLTISCVILPGVPTAMPSAMVDVPCGWCVPFTALTMAGKRAQSAADDLNARLDRPTPPWPRRNQPAAAHGDDQRVQVGQWPAASPAPACPGQQPPPRRRRCTKVSPRVRQHVGVGAGLFQRVAVQHHFGAKTRVRSTFTPGVKRGITMTARKPRRCAW